MTNQEILDKVYDIFIVKQNKPSAVFKGLDVSSCLYGTTVNGVGCAIGCLLPEDLANQLDKEYEGETITILFERFPEKFENLFIRAQLDLLSDLQHWHDIAAVSSRPFDLNDLRNIASRYDLKYPED